MGFCGNKQKAAQNENSYLGQLSRPLYCPVEKGRYNCTLSLSFQPRLWWKHGFELPMGCWSPFSQGQLLPSSVSHFASYKLVLTLHLSEHAGALFLSVHAGSATVKLEASNHSQAEMGVAFCLTVRVLLRLPALRGTVCVSCFWIFLLSNSEAWEGGVFCSLLSSSGCSGQSGIFFLLFKYPGWNFMRHLKWFF